VHKTIPEITFIVLTYNEAINLPHLLNNISGFAKDVLILDSYSTDKTVEIAESHGAKVFFREFDDFSMQRNYALENLPIQTEWIFFIDADEMLTNDLKNEICLKLNETKVDGFYIKRRFYWKGKWIKHGYYPIWLLRLGRYGKIKCDSRPINEHLICSNDNVDKLQNDFLDYNRKNLSDWIAKHNNYSDREAIQLINRDTNDKGKFFGNQYERKRWFRQHVWLKLPPLIRPLIYFLYRYFLRLGFLDDKEGFMYHFMHAFIYRIIIDFKYLEKKWFNEKK